MGKHIVFKRLAVEGFGSFIQPVEFQLNRGSINLIKGKNGHGKTTLFSAMLWVLYKVNLKGVNNDKVVSWDRLRSETFRGTRGILEFSIPEDGHDYLVARHIDFKGTTKSVKGKSTLMIFKKPSEKEAFDKEDMLGDEQYKGDQQGYINRVLGLDSKTFLNSVLFGQKMKRLIEAENEDKRKLFETLFDLDFVALCKKAADLKITEDTVKVEKLIAEITKDENEITLTEGQLEKDKELLQQFKTAREEALKRINDQLELKSITVDAESEALAKAKLDLESFDLSQLTEVENSIKNTNVELDKVKKEFQDTSDTVKAKLIESYEQNLDEYKAKRDAIDTELSVANNTIRLKTEAINSKSVELDTLFNSLKRDAVKGIEDTITNHKESLKALDSEFDKIGIDLKNAAIDKNSYVSSITASEVKIEKFKLDIEGVDTKCTYCLQDLPADKIAEVRGRIKSQLDEEVKVCQALKDKLPSLQEKVDELTNLSNDKNKFITDVKAVIEEYQIKLDTTLKEFNTDANGDYRVLTNEITDLKNSLKTFEDGKVDLINKLELAKKDVSEYSSAKVKVVDEVLANNTELRILSDKYTSLDAKLVTLKGEKVSLEAQSEKAAEAKINIPVIESKIVGLNESIKQLKSDIEFENSKKAPAIDITKYESRLFVLKTKATQDAELRSKMDEDLKRLNWWSKTGFGSSGLKSFVFNSGLVLLNKACEKYASRMGVRMEFSVDLSKTSKPFVTKCYKGEHAIDYADLSGGQQARLNVATAFAMHDLISANSNVNLLILDEIFESLDQEGIEDVFDLIRAKAGDNRTVYVVTHLSTIDALNTKTIEIVLDDNENSVIS